MGTDIHGVFQRRLPDTDTWEDIPHEYEMNRHYQLFAVLAGVRNGFGFAGVPTGEAVMPISEPRGFPPCFVVNGDDHPVTTLGAMTKGNREYRTHWPEEFEEAGGEAKTLVVDMGEHSYSWLSGAEMLAWYANAPSVTKTGVVIREACATWDRASRPHEYSGGISGPRIRVIDDAAAQIGWADYTHVQISWRQELKTELAYFFDEVARLQALHGEIRFVFGFDS